MLKDIRFEYQKNLGISGPSTHVLEGCKYGAMVSGQRLRRTAFLNESVPRSAAATRALNI